MKNIHPLHRLKASRQHLVDSITNAVPEYIREMPEGKLYLAIIEQCIKDMLTPPRRYSPQKSKVVPGKRPAHYKPKRRKVLGTVIEDYAYNAMVFMAGAGMKDLAWELGLNYHFFRKQVRRWLRQAGIHRDIRRIGYDEFYLESHR